MNRVLVAYFSHTGKTRTLANMIAEQLNGDCFEIEATKYPVDEPQCIQIANVESNGNARPDLKGTLPEIEQYDAVAVGFPNWNGTCPMAVLTFLESYDLTGKTVYPFITHEGSGAANSDESMRKSCRGADVKPVRDGNTLQPEDVKTWII